MATIPPGEETQPRLPEQLVEFPEGLRFHANALRDPIEYLGIFTIPVAEAPVLELVLSHATRADPDGLRGVVLGETGAGGGSAILVSDEDDGGYAAVFAHRTAAVLSWACGVAGDRYLSLNTAGRLGGSRVGIRFRVDGGPWEDAGSWDVHPGPTESVVVPEEQVEPLTLRSLAATEVAFVVTTEKGAKQAHAFEVTGLADALATRPCFRALAAGG
jgi:hypothetical protein